MQALGFTKAVKKKVPKDAQMLFLPMNGNNVVLGFQNYVMPLP